MLEPRIVPIFKGMPKATILQNPAWGVIIDCKDRQNYIYNNLLSWARSETCVESSYDYGRTNRTQLVGLTNASSASTVDLTSTITFPSTGLYRIEIEVYKGPGSTGSIHLHDGATQIEDVKSLYHKYGHHERIVYPVRRYTSGSHTLKITVAKPGMVSNIYIYPIKRYTAGSVDDSQSEDTLDIANIEYTMNAHNEMDTCNIVAGIKNDFWNADNPSKMEFGFTDSVTVLMGETKKDMEPVFGGYILGPIPSENMGSMTLKCVNRFLDMMRVPTYHDFYIGTTPADASTVEQSFMNFSSVYKLNEYLASTITYPINCAGIPFDYGMNIDFSESNDFTSIVPGGLKKYWDTGFGHPAPSLKLTPGNNAGKFECVLWYGEQDIADYEMFNLDYHVSGAGAKYPLKFDLKFSMYKSGETVANAKDYIVRFNGTDKQTNIIGTFKQDLATTWPSLTFNLKTLFDNYKTSASSEYHVTKISMVGTITPSQATHPLCSALWVDQIYTFSELEHAPTYNSSGVNYPFDEVTEICNTTDHVAYIVPGLERINDIFVVKPLEIAITDETLTDGQYGNVLEISNWNDDPIASGYKNQANRTFNKYVSKDKTTPSNTFEEDVDEVALNGPFQDHEFYDTINTQAASDVKTKQYILDHALTQKAYSVTIPGSTLIQPCHYIVANIVEGRIVNTDKIITITQTLNISEKLFTCTIDLNEPSKRYIRKLKGSLKQIQRNINKTGINNDYRQNVGQDVGTTSPGAFSNY